MISEHQNIDRMKYMSFFNDKFFSLVTADPEYGIGESGKNHKTRNTLVRQADGISMRRCPSTNYTRKEWDNNIPPDDFFEEIKRVGQHRLIFGANYFPQIVGTAYKPPRRNDFEYFIKHNPKGWIVWDKVNGTSDFSDCELIYTTFDFDSYILPYMWAGMMQGKSIAEGTVMQGNKALNEKRIHPTQKPVIIYKHFLSKLCGKNVLDPGTGAGSSRIAAYELDIDFYGCDNDKEYFNKSTKRFQNYISQTNLFRNAI